MIDFVFFLVPNVILVYRVYVVPRERGFVQRSFRRRRKIERGTTAPTRTIPAFLLSQNERKPVETKAKNGIIATRYAGRETSKNPRNLAFERRIDEKIRVASTKPTIGHIEQKRATRGCDARNSESPRKRAETFLWRIYGGVALPKFQDRYSCRFGYGKYVGVYRIPFLFLSRLATPAAILLSRRKQ